MSEKSSNVVWHEQSVTRAMRATQNGHKGCVVWLTGLSGSGKSTVANAFNALLFQKGFRGYLLDGDNVRHGLNGDLGFSDSDREENIRRVGEVAKLLADAGFITSVAFISPFRKDRARAKKICEESGIPFFEIFVACPLATCEKRDPKGLYKKARAGEISDFTGLTSPYEEPLTPSLVLDSSKEIPSSLAEKIFALLESENIFVVK